MTGKLLSLPGELPTLNDWENHLTTIFPEVNFSLKYSIIYLSFCGRFGFLT
jgi:gamma-glutamylcysteine synthetase